MKHEDQIQTAIRLPESLFDRLDKLAEQLSRPGMKATRAGVMRLAVFRGVEQLEAEYKKARTSRGGS
jgi:predicted DNA-binding protein